MVRLKATFAGIATPATNPFQFLMVRLKEAALKESIRLYQISIPYGSIKSSFSIRSLMALYISIPYGSIKRGTPLFYPGN